jgi:hypothetical protein
MNIKLENFKSIRTDLELELKGINIFIGGTGTGKSLVADCLKLFAKNHQIEGCERGNFSGVCNFDSFLDWRNYTHFGNLKRPTVIGRTINFVGMELRVEVSYQHTSTIGRADDPNIVCAEVVGLTVYHENYPIVIWNAKERKIYQSNFYRVMQLGLKKRGRSLNKEWEDWAGLPPAQAKQMSMRLLDRFLNCYPKQAWIDKKRDYFIFDLGDIYRSFHFDIRDNMEFVPVAMAGQHLFIQVMDGMTNLLSDVIIARGETQPVLDQYLAEAKQDKCGCYFGIELIEKEMRGPEGQYWGKQLYLKHNWVTVPYSMASPGIRRIASWVHEMEELKQQLAAPMGRPFVRRERLVIFQHPEQDLTPNWLFWWTMLLVNFWYKVPGATIIIETRNPQLIECIQSQIINKGLFDHQVRVFSFSHSMALGTTVKTIDINAKGELSDSLSSSCEDIFLTQMGQDKLRKELLGEGVLMGN